MKCPGSMSIPPKPTVATTVFISRRLKFLAQILDQIHEVFLVDFLGNVLVFVSLEPDEAGDLVALSFG